MLWTVDRIEENIAVIEYDLKKMARVPLAALPEGVKENDVIRITLDAGEKEKRLERIKNLSDRLFED